MAWTAIVIAMLGCEPMVWLFCDVRNTDITQNIEQALQTIASYLPSPAGEGQGVRAINPKRKPSPY
jgi:hypothetical protein